MKKVIQTIMVVPISETIGKAFGSNTLLGTGAAIVTARFVLSSFAGMVALGAVAGCLNYLQNYEHGAGGHAKQSSRQNNQLQKSADGAEPVSA